MGIKTSSSTTDDEFMRAVINAMIILIPLVVVNNTMIAFVLLKNKHWRKRSSTVFMVMMAITDIFGVGSRNLDFVYEDIIENCILHGFTNFGAIFPVWMQVCLVTERAIAVSCPMKSKFILTRRNAAITSAVLLICFLFVFFLPNMLGLYDGACAFTKGNEFISALNIVIYFVVPFMWTVISNGIIVWHLKRRMASQNSENAKNIANSVLRIALVFSITFFIFSAPLSIYNFIFNFTTSATEIVVNEGHQTKYKVLQILQLFSNLFHATNIILYIISSKTFRDDLIRSIKETFRCICL